MNRYRLGLLAVLALTALVVGVVRLWPSTPSGGSDTAADLIPVQQRISAPDFVGIAGWINSGPLNIRSLHGRVVLVDFWTFSCVNCVRTLPYLRDDFTRFQKLGFLIVGVHSPEFDFEKVPANVSDAVRRLDVTWPVALDSEMATWRAYGNEVWPAEYLIDQAGKIAYVNFGEGNYARTAGAIAALLGASQRSAPTSLTAPVDITPELYAGGARGHLADGAGYAPGEPTLYPDRGPPNQSDAIQVTGTWTDFGQYLQADAAGHVRLRFHAGKVFVVSGASGPVLGVVVELDGAPVSAPMDGSALAASRFEVQRRDLYQLLSGVGPGQHLLDLAVPTGFQLYTFTFGQ